MDQKLLLSSYYLFKFKFYGKVLRNIYLYISNTILNINELLFVVFLIK